MQTIVVIGGDERAARLATFCETAGFVVHTWGLREDDEQACPVEDADAILFPYPFSVKNMSVPNLRGLAIDPADVLARVPNGVHILGGQSLRAYVAAIRAKDKNVFFREYDEDSTFLQANADISAEGALCYAMQQLDCTLEGAACLVTGYGLFARAIALKAKALGAQITVAARSAAARLLALEDGMKAITLEDLPSAAQSIRVLLNTVPARVVGEEALDAFPQKALLLELASAPYGFDMEAVRQKGLSAALLPGIPGRYAPETAAKALYHAMIRLTEGEKL